MDDYKIYFVELEKLSNKDIIKMLLQYILLYSKNYDSLFGENMLQVVKKNSGSLLKNHYECIITYTRTQNTLIPLVNVSHPHTKETHDYLLVTIGRMLLTH